MRVVSVNVSAGRTVVHKGKKRTTGIYKEPVAGAVAVRALGLDGDVQVDKRYHGGPGKAVYSFAAEDYAAWGTELGAPLGPGSFGENLTTEGLDESAVREGDVYRFGGAELQAVEPRQPCGTLAMKFDDAKLPKKFVRKGRFGIYWRVVKEGRIRAGDPIRALSRGAGPTITELGCKAAG